MDGKRTLRLQSLASGFYVRLFLCFVLVILLYFGLLSAACALPAGRLMENLDKSAGQLADEGLYPRYFGQDQRMLMDNYTDALMLNIIGTVDPAHPAASALRASFTTGPDAKTPLQKLETLTKATGESTVEYSRYWHGYLVFLRPLLLRFELSAVRLFSFLFQMLLFCLTAALLYRRANLPAVLGLGAALALSGFPLTAFCLQFSGVFVIAMAGMCFVLGWNGSGGKRLSALFLFLGSLTCFIDLLTAPLLTCLLPLTVLLILRAGQPQAPERKPLALLWEMTRLGAFWILGYLLTWASKWALASLLLGWNAAGKALDSLSIRTGGLQGGGRLGAAALNLETLIPFENGAMVCLALLAALWLPALLFRRARRKGAGVLLLCAAVLLLVPPAWFVLTANHASIHYWMTFRNQAAAVWLCLILGDLICPYADILRRFKRKQAAS